MVMVDFPSFPLRNIVVSALSLTYQKVLIYYILVRVRIHTKLGTLIFRLSLHDSILICPSLQFEAQRDSLESSLKGIPKNNSIKSRGGGARQYNLAENHQPSGYYSRRSRGGAGKTII